MSKQRNGQMIRHMHRTTSKRYLMTLFTIVMLIFVSCSTTDIPEVKHDEDVRVYFFDVGQGDATLLDGPDFTVLVDAGRHDRNDVLPLLEEVGIDSLDVLIGTHPHADHIGQFESLLRNMEVEEVWMSGDTHTTQTFERTIDAIFDSGAAYEEPRAGQQYAVGSLFIEVYNPETLSGDLHEGSLSFRATYGDVSFMFTGDAEAHTEQMMIDRGHDLQAHIFQLGHHGSSTSNTRPFLEAVNPEVGIYSAAEGNRYGHPHDEVVARFKDMEIPLLGTDLHSTILVTTDGESVEIHTSPAR